MQASRRSLWLVVLAGIIAIPAHAEQGDDSTILLEPHRTIVFSPDRPERCDYFFVTEFNTSVTGMQSQDAVDRFLFTDALGLMRNIDRSRAVGISIDAHLSAGAVRFAPTLRFRQWLARRSSLDLSVGFTADVLENEGVAGPVVNARYGFNEWFHVQAGACRIRSVTSIYYYPEYRVVEESPVTAYAGVGLGGVPGIISWGAQAIGAGTAALLFSGME